jgi:hypothetical protein
MQEFVDALIALRSDCGAKNDELHSKLGTAVGQAPIGGLGIAFNNLTIAAELASYYLQHWSGNWAGVDQLERRRNENRERCILLGKSLFISVISGCEWQAREAVKAYPSVLCITRRRPYLREILDASNDAGLLASGMFTLWEGAIIIRNCLVHNNGFADENAAWTFTPALTIALEDGKMVQGTMMSLPNLTRWALLAYADWCEAFLARTK